MAHFAASFGNRRVASLLLAVTAAVAAVACGGGGGGNGSAGLIHRLLLAASGQGTTGLESFPGRLPPNLGTEPPVYPGARIIVSSRQPSPLNGQTPQPTAGNIPQPMIYLIVLDTGHDRSAVFAYYEKALDESPWQLEGTSSANEVDSLQFSNAQDADISGFVTIAGGGSDHRTSILISLQDSGAFRQELPPYTPPPSLQLPSRFPKDVTVYPDATITGTAYFREEANDDFLITFITTASQDEVIQFYRQAFQQNGWTILAGAPLGLEDRLDFNDDKGDIQGSVLADRFSEDRRYTEVQLQVTANQSRVPANGTPGATPPATSERATPSPPAATP